MNARIPALAFVLILGGCAMQPTQRYDFCATAKPIYVSAADTLSDGTAKQIEAHDETGAKLCGWK